MDIKDKYNYKSNTSGAIVWGTSWPGGLYLAINFGLSFVLVFLLIFWIIINRSNEFEPGFIMEKVIQWSIPLTLAIQVITTVIYAIFYKKAVKECLPVVKQKTNWSRGIWSILLMLGVSSISSYILDFIQRFIPDFGSSYDSIVESMFSTALPLTVLSTVIMAPICEELMMRGLTFNRLLSGVKKWPAILISAAIFGFIHLNLLQGLNAFASSSSRRVASPCAKLRVKAWIQRVSSASVTIDGEQVAAIGRGYLVLLGVTHTDTTAEADKIADRIPVLRLFRDGNEQMNLSLEDVGGAVIVVSQFTLYADTAHGRRPSFGNAARPELAEPLYERVVARLRERLGAERVGTGRFGADMKVALVNDGPVSIELRIEAAGS